MSVNALVDLLVTVSQGSGLGMSAEEETGPLGRLCQVKMLLFMSAEGWRQGGLALPPHVNCCPPKRYAFGGF